MEQLCLNFICDRMDGLLRRLSKTSAEYATALSDSHRLYEQLSGILHAKEPVTITPADCWNLRGFIDKQASMQGVAQEEAYRLGCRDCVLFLRSLGVLA